MYIESIYNFAFVVSHSSLYTLSSPLFHLQLAFSVLFRYASEQHLQYVPGAWTMPCELVSPTQAVGFMEVIYVSLATVLQREMVVAHVSYKRDEIFQRL